MDPTLTALAGAVLALLCVALGWWLRDREARAQLEAADARQDLVEEDRGEAREAAATAERTRRAAAEGARAVVSAAVESESVPTARLARRMLMPGAEDDHPDGPRPPAPGPPAGGEG